MDWLERRSGRDAFDEIDEDRSVFVDELEFAATWADIEGQYLPGAFKPPPKGSGARRYGRVALLLSKMRLAAANTRESVRGSMIRLTAGTGSRSAGAAAKSSKPRGPGHMQRS